MLRATKMAGLVVLVLSASGCAGVKGWRELEAEKLAQQAPAVDRNGKPLAANDSQVVCKMEWLTGSNIPERVCRTVAPESDVERQRTQDMMRQLQQSGPTLGGAGSN
jgi:hypothetical protein